MPLHLIPNYALGKVSRRSVTRVFFPRKYSAGGPHEITSTELETIYNEGVRATIDQITPEATSHWPVSYRAAMDQYRRSIRGGFTLSTVDVAALDLDEFGQQLLDSFNQHQQLRDAYFVHEVRGTKLEFAHRMRNRREERSAYNDMLSFLDRGKLKLEEWWVDVGLEIFLRGHVVSWFRMGHSRVLRHALQDTVSQQQIDGLVENKRRFQVDRMALLGDVAGFRAKLPVTMQRASSMTYISAYCTEKTVTYQLHTGIYRRRRAKELLQTKTLENIIQDMETMSQTLVDCIGNGRVQAQEGCARLEVRVPLDMALNANNNFPDDLLVHALVVTPSRHWW